MCMVTDTDRGDDKLFAAHSYAEIPHLSIANE